MKINRAAILGLLLFASASAEAAPAYGSTKGIYDATTNDVGQKCLYNFSFWDAHMYGTGAVQPVSVFIDSNFDVDWNSVMPTVGTPPDLTDDQAATMLQSAMEEWNLNSRGPVFIWGEQKTISTTGLNTVANCSALTSLPPRSVYVHFVPGAGNGGNAEPFRSGGAVCDNQKYVLWLQVGFGTARNFHGLRANLVHELGHAVGLGHTHGSGGTNTEYGPPAAMARHDSISRFYDNVVNANVGTRAAGRFSASNQTRLQNPAAACVSNVDCDQNAHCSAGQCRVRVQQDTTSYDPGACPSANGEGAESVCPLASDRLHYNHLWPYDIDCVDDRTNGAVFQDARRRRLSYMYTAKSAVSFGPLQAAGAAGSTSKGFLSGGRFRGTPVGSGPEPVVYGCYLDSLTANERILVAAGLNYDGAFSWGSTNDIAGTNLQDLSAAPLFTAVYEKPTLSFRSVLMHAAAARDDLSYVVPETPADHPEAFAPKDDAVSLLDPPVIRQQRGIAIGQLSWIEDLYSCSSSPGCDERLVQTHVALSSAHDTVSDKTIFVTVPSRGNCSTADTANGLTCGRIYVHPGYASSVSDPSHNVHQTLARPTMLKAVNANPPPIGEVQLPAFNGANGYKYSGRTDVGVAVTCAPDPRNVHNCYLAWVDNGTPDGDVLFVRFFVDGSDIVFDSMIGRVDDSKDAISQTRSMSNLSAAFHGDKVWIAYKKVGDATASNGIGAIGTGKWYAANPFDYGQRFDAAANVVDPPTWLYDPFDDQLEAGLIFTTHAP